MNNREGVSLDNGTFLKKNQDDVQHGHCLVDSA